MQGATDAILALVQHGADLVLWDAKGSSQQLSYSQSVEGYAPIHYATERGDLTVVHVLLSHGMDPNTRIQVAARSGSDL
jgi:ankyrin repeat protein